MTETAASLCNIWSSIKKSAIYGVVLKKCLYFLQALLLTNTTFFRIRRGLREVAQQGSTSFILTYV